MQHNLCLLKTEHTEDNTVNSSSFGDIDSFGCTYKSPINQKKY